jgi:hypothetical protein
MNWKFFLFLVGVIVCSYVIIRWLGKAMDKASVILPYPRREIGFKAMMERPIAA